MIPYSPPDRLSVEGSMVLIPVSSGIQVHRAKCDVVSFCKMEIIMQDHIDDPDCKSHIIPADHVPELLGSWR